ncbi:MAG: hypothetical protein GXY88_02920 [Tissierellia bacterium]|nr:hypothetical protein [Tissierellia bacterium]
MELEKIVLEGLIAFLPAYIRLKGNCTILYTQPGGVYEIERAINTILKRLANIYLIDLKATKKYYGDILNMKNLVPIPFTRDNVFVPIKVRKPLYKNDGSFGYVNIRYINKTSKANGKTIITLTNGKTIESISSIETVNKHIKNGHIVKRLSMERAKLTPLREEELYQEYNKPATKADIALLISEIIKMKDDFLLGKKSNCKL